MEARIENTGFMEEVPGAIDKIPDYDPRSGNHLWTMHTMYKCDPEKMFNEKEKTFFDHESLLLVVGPGCYYCEQAYSPQLLHRRCKGNP